MNMVEIIKDKDGNEILHIEGMSFKSMEEFNKLLSDNMKFYERRLEVKE